MKLRFCVLLPFFLFALCTTGVAPGGSGTETTTGIVGAVVDEQGMPQANVRVQLFPSGFDPVQDTSLKVRADTTDTLGRYFFTGMDSGSYSLQAVHNTRFTRARIGSVNVQHDTIVAATGILQKPGVVLVAIPAATELVTPAYVYIPGTTIYAHIKNGTKFLQLDSVPAGLIPEILSVTADGGDVSTLRYNIEVKVDDTVLVQNPSWRYSRTLSLNTTESGAGVTTNVYGFPILVRLNKDKFDFSQAQPGGADIRFAKRDGSFLNVEIERWDTNSQRAEVWVWVDTVYGNHSNQELVMYWGNAKAGSVSNGEMVFDTTKGFISVWHMNEEPSTAEASVMDQTANKHNAKAYGGMSGSNSVEGAVAGALRFDGIDDYLNAGKNVSVPGIYTIGLWAMIDTMTLYHRFLYKDSSYTLWYDKDSVSIRMEHRDTTRWRGLLQDGGTRVSMTTDDWYYITATFDGNVIRLYRNGSEMTNSKVITARPMVNSRPLLLGGSSPHFTKGVLDEIRIEGVVRSPDWIRLCYINQRTDDRLVQFK